MNTYAWMIVDPVKVKLLKQNHQPQYPQKPPNGDTKSFSNNNRGSG